MVAQTSTWLRWRVMEPAPSRHETPVWASSPQPELQAAPPLGVQDVTVQVMRAGSPYPFFGGRSNRVPCPRSPPSQPCRQLIFPVITRCCRRSSRYCWRRHRRQLHSSCSTTLCSRLWPRNSEGAVLALKLGSLLPFLRTGLHTRTESASQPF